MTRQTLEAIEAERLAAQAALDGARDPAERNRQGQFATPPALAREMAALAKDHLPPGSSVRLLDPGLGTGVFLYAALSELGPRRVEAAVGFENDAEVAAVAERLWRSTGFCLRVEDFCTARPPAAEEGRATLTLCNPPYVRHHHLPAAQKAGLRREAKEVGIPVSWLEGLYCYFLLLAHRWLDRDGLGVWIIPAEFLDVNYGRAVKQYLATRVTPPRHIIEVSGRWELGLPSRSARERGAPGGRERKAPEGKRSSPCRWSIEPCEPMVLAQWSGTPRTTPSGSEKGLTSSHQMELSSRAPGACRLPHRNRTCLTT